ncbi:hypothetical protein AX17_002998 [Amanita inopinata Kibby_2008]|nr:hypothetical protein AX17_002998 [Amanita inopinata Kibby_2008]
MSLRKLLVRKKRVAAEEPTPPVVENSHYSSSFKISNVNAWMNNLISVMNIASASGEAFPPLKTTVGLLTIMLSNIKDVRRNKEDLRHLVTEITELMKMLNDRVEAHGESATKQKGLMDVCSDFNTCLSSILQDLSTLLTESHKSWTKQLLYKDALAGLVAGYTKRLSDLKLHFLVWSFLGICFANHQTTTREGDGSTLSDMELSDYYRLKLSDIDLVGNLPSQPSSDNEDVQIEEYYARVRSSDAINTVRLYNGSDALTLLRNEFERFSRLKHPNILQVFGVCDSKRTPGIVFYGQLIRWADYERELSPIDGLIMPLQFYNDYKSAEPYFRRHFKINLPSGILYSWDQLEEFPRKVYIDVGTDFRKSIWPLPEPCDKKNNFGIRIPWDDEGVPVYPLELMQHVALALRYRTLPTNPNVKRLLTAFYDAMMFGMAQNGPTDGDLNLPLPLLKVNQVYVSGTKQWEKEIRKLSFGEGVSVTGWKSTPWKILDQRPEDECIKMGEWTRIQVATSRKSTLPNCSSSFELPNADRNRAFHALVPQLRKTMVMQTTDDNKVLDPFALLHSIQVRIGLRSRVHVDPNRPDIRVLYFFIRELDFTRRPGIEAYWSTDPEGETRMEREELDRFGVVDGMVFCKRTGLVFEDVHFEAVKVMHELCGYGGPEGEEGLMALFGVSSAVMTSC